MSSDRQPASEIPVSPAATVMVLRDTDAGLEVFMLRRTLSAAFARGQYVFPGGRVDAGDGAAGYESVCDGFGDAAASHRLGLSSGGLAWFVAAIRECFEEAGILLARPAASADVIRFDDPVVTARFAAARLDVHAGQRTLLDLCVAEDLQLLVDRLHVVAHWVTPLGERRRFDTRFLVAEAPASQVPLHDDRETIASIWVRPDDALARWRVGELQMFPPTVVCLEQLAGYADVAEAMHASRQIGVPDVIEPRLILSESGKVLGVRVPGDDGFDETPIQEFVIGQPR